LTAVPPLVVLVIEGLPLIEDLLGCRGEHVLHRCLDRRALPGPHGAHRASSWSTVAVVSSLGGEDGRKKCGPARLGNNGQPHSRLVIDDIDDVDDVIPVCIFDLGELGTSRVGRRLDLCSGSTPPTVAGLRSWGVHGNRTGGRRKI